MLIPYSFSLGFGRRLGLLSGLIFSCIPTGQAASQSHLLRPTDLRCDEKSDPLAIASPHPDFSWQLTAPSSALHGVKQTAYHIQVAGTIRAFGPNERIEWDSGKIASSAIAGIAYSGPMLEPQHEYVWRVEVWDENGRPSGWSAPAHWMQAPQWHAHWIAAHADGNSDRDGPMPLFRKTFTLNHPVARALLYVSGLGQDEVHINSHKVSEDVLTPGWGDYRKTVYYDSYDVTKLLTNGANAIGIMLGNGMYRVFHTPGRYTKFVGSFGQPVCAVQLHVEFIDGSSTEIVSNGTWKTASGPITFSSTYGGEDYDARLEPLDWDSPRFDDAAWSAAQTVSGPGGTLISEIAPPIRVVQTYASAKVTQPRSGILIYDLGQNFAGWPVVTVSGPAGATVKLIPGELLDQDGLVTQRSSKGPQWFSYTLRGGGIEIWHPRFSYYGFRYIQVEGASTTAAAGQVHIMRLVGEAIHTSSQQIGDFSSSDDLLNRIHALILHAVENNSMSLFTDCPHREKLGWLEQVHLLAPSLLYDFDFAEMYAATARSIADEQRKEGPQAGMVPEIAPQYVVFDPVSAAAFNDSPEWGSAAVLGPWYLYERTGNRNFLAEQYDVMGAYVRYLATRAHEGIINYGLGDWYDIGPGAPGFSKLTSAGVTATAIYFQDLKAMESAAAALGKTDEGRTYGEQAEYVRSAFNARFFDTSRQHYDKGSQTAQAMPLALDMVPEQQRVAVLDALVADIRAHQNHVTSGDIGYHYVVDALLDGGRSDVLFDMLERTDAPSYGYQLAQGATSLTEAWDANPNSSQDHFMLGDAEEWFYRGLGGINLNLAHQPAAGIVLHPAVVGNITRVQVHYRSALGPIESDWRRTSAAIEYDFTIPANAEATLEIDSADPSSLTVNDLPPSKAAGVLSTHLNAKQITIEVGSGNYRIHAANGAR